VVVGRGTEVFIGVAVASGWEDGSPQAALIMERIKTKDSKVVSLLDGFMDRSFFEKSICQLYKQAAFAGGL
jgi:hypothetical protein